RAVQADIVVMLDVAPTRRLASSSDSGVPGRMHSPLSDLCQRSIFPFDCGKNGEVRTCVIPEIRMNSLKSLAMNCGPLSEMIRGRARSEEHTSNSSHVSI